jgi:hypothetical protein
MSQTWLAKFIRNSRRHKRQKVMNEQIKIELNEKKLDIRNYVEKLDLLRRSL